MDGWETYLAGERLLAGVYSQVSRELVAPTETALALVERTFKGSLLDGRLRGPIGVLARLNGSQIERIAAGLLEYLQPFAGGRTIGRQHGCCLAAVLVATACHFALSEQGDLSNVRRLIIINICQE